ncbi:hypothetical protein EMCRGX_G026452 [Ephydatia muelleri]
MAKYILCFAGGLVATIGMLIYKYWIQFRTLERLGVMGPKPSLYYGSAREYCGLGPLKFMQQLINKYGPVCGFYYGAKPILVITDCDMIEQVLCKDFKSFSEREHVVDYLKKKAAKCRGLLQAKGEAWKRARQIVQPSLKGKAALFQANCEAICEVLDRHARSGEAVDIYRIFGQFTMETILAVVFSHRVGILRGDEDQFTRLSQCILRDGQAAAYFGGGDCSVPVFLSNFPFLEYFVRMYHSCSEAGKSSKMLTDNIIELIKARRAETGQHQDVLQTMIDGNTHQQLSDEEIAAHSKNLLLAGFESMANLLAYTSYLLALNPDKQAKLHEEIDSYFKVNPETEPKSAVDRIKYLDCVIQESLRLFQQKPTKCTFLPFGDGNRQCIGKMLAEATTKLFFIETLRKYKLVMDSKTEVPLVTQCGITFSPKNGIYLRIVPHS